MTFILRATLVIGALTYFAAQRQGTTTPVVAPAPVPPKSVDLAASWHALPGSIRERIAHETTAELARRLAVAEPSQDTLAEGDRRPAWRGKDAR